MEQFIIDQVSYSLKALPCALIKSYLKAQTNNDVKAFKQKAEGFICGVCHPNENYEQIYGAGIRWVRIDIPFPYDKNGDESESYRAFKERCDGYQQRGMKVMAVTPYPSTFIENGIDPRTDEAGVRRIAQFIVQDMTGYANALQITNEMGMPNFTLPLNMDEAVRFIGVQLEAMEAVKGDMLVGYNSAGPQADLHVKMKPYYKYCDYVGIDIYMGCFASLPGFMWVFGALVRYLWGLTGKPILLQEFGYIGAGAPKTKAEKVEILKGYGVSSEKQAREKIAAFVSALPERMCNHVRRISPDESHQADYIFKSDFVNHLYCELPKITKIPGYPHTHKGQAKFFEKLIPKLYSYGFVCGAFIYCYSDSKECYICSQADCPTETSWGLVTVDGKPKPAYEAVKTVFNAILANEKRKLGR